VKEYPVRNRVRGVLISPDDATVTGLRIVVGPTGAGLRCVSNLVGFPHGTPEAHGLQVSTEGVTIRGFIINRFELAGVFLTSAAVQFSPDKAEGIDGTLRTLAHTPLGPWLLVLVAAGLVAFGLFSWTEARWRRV